ncbi:hypothetical protein [uncultured Thiodictyon sp.]|uniref:hypothetical protein n=1 Tax=uncultured Thiodictyon sp. TaxID=1846217 RepID=UPI0025DC60E9|nr:hypothetical protein [uncultured Thiodictyon sp.]
MTHPRPIRPAPAAVAPPADDDPLITANTARALAGDVSAMTIWRWQRAGIIPAPLKIRTRNYWRKSAFLAALQAAGTVAEAA